MDTTGRNHGIANIRIKQQDAPAQQLVGFYVPAVAVPTVMNQAETMSPADRVDALAERQEGFRLRYRE